MAEEITKTEAPAAAPAPPGPAPAAEAAAPAAAASTSNEDKKRPAEDDNLPDAKRVAMPAVSMEESSANAESQSSTTEAQAPRGEKGSRGGKGGRHLRADQKKAAREKHAQKSRERGRGGRESWFTKREKKPVNEEEALAYAAAREAKEGEEGEKEKRLPKKRAAVMVGYCGTGYSGMQIQTHGSRTIEGDLFAALAKAGAISEENALDHKKVDLQRAARTDAGVHAAGNCISFKMILDPPLPEGFSDLTEYVNSMLPDQIRMWGYVRTMKSFQARTACDSRVYEYLLPSYCLLPPASTDPFAKTLDETSPGWREVVKVPAEFVNAAPPPPEPVEGETIDPKSRGEFERRRGWRCDPDTLARFREIIAVYKGTHNFHNYTVGKPFNDNSVKRFMISLDVRDPTVYGDIEWISVRIHGQSFMLHQIRKMMSLAMLACRTGTPASLLPETFGPKRIHIPKAPPLGLLLEQPQFKTYNERARTLPKSGDETRSYVDFSKYADKMHDFKVKWIYERLREVELESNVFHKWIRQIDCTASKTFSFLNTAGTIPDEALVTLTSKKYIYEGTKKERRAAADGAEGAEGEEEDQLESDDEELDAAALKSGELEG